MLPSKIRPDQSIRLLLFSNVIVIILALVQHWSIGELLWIYWWQNVIIGFFNWRRILTLKSFSTMGFKIDGNQSEASPQNTKINRLVFSSPLWSVPYLLWYISCGRNFEAQPWLHAPRSYWIDNLQM